MRFRIYPKNLSIFLPCSDWYTALSAKGARKGIREKGRGRLKEVPSLCAYAGVCRQTPPRGLLPLFVQQPPKRTEFWSSSNPSNKGRQLPLPERAVGWVVSYEKDALASVEASVPDGVIQGTLLPSEHLWGTSVVTYRAVSMTLEAEIPSPLLTSRTWAPQFMPFVPFPKTCDTCSCRKSQYFIATSVEMTTLQHCVQQNSSLIGRRLGLWLRPISKERKAPPKFLEGNPSFAKYLENGRRDFQRWIPRLRAFTLHVKFHPTVQCVAPAGRQISKIAPRLGPRVTFIQALLAVMDGKW